MKEERHKILGQWSVIEVDGEKNLSRRSIIGPIEDPHRAKAQDSTWSSPCANLQLQTSKKTSTITQTPTQRLRFCMIKDRQLITLNPNELESVARWRANSVVRRSERWQTSTMPELSFQERWRNQVERREERRWMLQKRRCERWWNERRNGKVYANENLRKCRIWLLKVFDLLWRRRLIIGRWMSFAIDHLWRCGNLIMFFTWFSLHVIHRP